MQKKDIYLEQTYRVRSYECGPDGYLQLTQVCNYLQETASTHADILGLSKETLSAYNLTWVLARLRVKLERYPKWRDDVKVLTFPHSMRKLTAQRDFILTLSDDTPIGIATSEWMGLDLATRRAARLPKVFSNCNNTVRTPVWSQNPFTKPTYPDEGIGERQIDFRVQYSHIDLNGHVNNVRYIEWIMETASGATSSEKVAEIEIAFKAEAFVDETVTSRSSELLEQTFSHCVSTPSQDLVLAVSKWKEFAD